MSLIEENLPAIEKIDSKKDMDEIIDLQTTYDSIKNSSMNEKHNLSDEVKSMDASNKIPDDLSRIDFSRVLKKRQNLNKFIRNVTSKRNHESEEIVPIEKVLNQTFKEESIIKLTNEDQLDAEKTKISPTNNSTKSLNVSLYELFERLEQLTTGEKVNYKICFKENSSNSSTEFKLRFYGSNGKTKKFKLNDSDLKGYELSFRNIGEIFALSLEYTNEIFSSLISKVNLIDTKNDLVLNFETNDWFNVKLEKNKLATFMFKTTSQKQDEINLMTSYNQTQTKTKVEQDKDEPKDFKSIIKDFKTLEKKPKNIFANKKMLAHLRQMEISSNTKEVVFDGFMIGFLLSNLEYQLKEVKFVRVNIKLLLRILAYLSTNNPNYVIELGSNEKHLNSVIIILRLLLKTKDKELLVNLINTIYEIAKHSYLFYNKWIDSDILQQLLDVLEDIESSFEISNCIFQIIKASYNYNNFTDSNILFTTETNSDKVNIYKYIGQLKIDSTLLKNIKFRNVFLYLESLSFRFKDVNVSNRMILMKFLTLLTKMFIENIQNDLEMIDFKRFEVMKSVAYLDQILSIFQGFTQSNEFCYEFQKNDYCLKLLFNFLTNSANLNHVIKDYKFQYIVLEYLYSKMICLIVKLFKFTTNVSSLDLNNFSILKSFIKSSIKFNSKTIYNSLLLILYQYGYKETENMISYSKYFELDEHARYTILNATLTELFSIENISCVLDKRSLLNPILFLCDDDKYYKNLDIDMQKKFIRFSIDFLKFCFSNVDNLDLPNEDYYNEKFIKSIKMLLFLNHLLAITTNISNNSNKFCSQFHKNSENGILILFNLLTCTNIDQYLLEQNDKSDIFYVVIESVYDGILSTLLNLSRTAFKYNQIWHETIDPILILYDVAHNFNNANDKFTLCAYITIANIVSDSEISKLITKAKNVIGTIVDKIEMIVSILETEISENVERIDIYLEDDDKQPVQIAVVDSEWHLGELIQALFVFSKSDQIKFLIYMEENMKEFLTKIIQFGNEFEKEFAFKLLYQLAFDDRIAKDINNDRILYGLIEKNLEKSKNCQGIMWTINNKLNKNFEIDERNIDEPNKHVMISYNKESREVCYKIKTELEKLGINCWIDVDNIHGSSLEAMASAIERASCILVCMTEKYKESPNCRLEAEYIIQRKKPFIPLIMQKGYKPDGWLGLILGAKIFIDINKYEFQGCLNKIVKEIREITKYDAENSNKIENLEEKKFETKTREETRSVSETLIPKSTSIIAVTQSMSLRLGLIFNWSNVEVGKWLEEKKFNPNIVSSVKNFNGELLFYLYKMNLKSLSFFYEKINSESYSPLTLFDLIYFNCELDKLFKEYA